MTTKIAPITVLVLGASGATGRLLVQQLLDRGLSVRAVVRNRSSLPPALADAEGLTIHEASVLDLETADLVNLVKGCAAVASCLGHNLTFKGVFGSPRRLVTDAARRICNAVQETAPDEPVRFVLMNTTGNRNRGLDERISFAQKCVIGLLRVGVPPHADNEDAAEFLRSEIGSGHPHLQWCAVRPDGLTDEEAVTDYELHPSPTRSAIFDAGKTSRINVADFMARLAEGGELWEQWQGQMPVIYNK